MLDGDLNTAYKIPDKIWEKIMLMLPPVFPRNRNGSRMDDRKAMEAILYVFRSGCKWKSIPESMGNPDAIWERFREWQESGVFQQMWIAGILTYDELRVMIWYDEMNC